MYYFIKAIDVSKILCCILKNLTRIKIEYWTIVIIITWFIPLKLDSSDLWSGIVTGKYKNSVETGTPGEKVSDQQKSTHSSVSSSSSQINSNSLLNNKPRQNLISKSHASNTNNHNPTPHRQYSMDPASSSSSISTSPNPKSSLFSTVRQRHVSNNQSTNPNKNVVFHKKGAYGFGRGSKPTKSDQP